MAKRKRAYPLAPKNVNASTWLYFEPKGVCVVRQIRDDDDVLRQSDMFHIPWRFIEAAAAVHRSAKRIRAASTRANK